MSRYDIDQGQQRGDSLAKLALETGKLVRRRLEPVASASEASLTMDGHSERLGRCRLSGGDSPRRSCDGGSLQRSVSRGVPAGMSCGCSGPAASNPRTAGERRQRGRNWGSRKYWKILGARETPS